MLIEILSKHQIVDGILLPYFREASEYYQDAVISRESITKTLNDQYTSFLGTQTPTLKLETLTTYGFTYLTAIVYAVSNLAEDGLLDYLDERATVYMDMYIMLNKFLGRGFNEEQAGKLGSMVSAAVGEYARLSMLGEPVSMDFDALLSAFFSSIEQN